MPKYINEDEALDLIHEHNDELYAPDDEDIITYLLENMPSDDVVEVVRCKDCKYYTTGNGGVCEKPYNGLMFAERDSFCSYGERKETE